MKSRKIKNKLKEIYSYYLPKGKIKYFAYLAISIDPAHIDVNVHPSKKEVIFMYEDDIIEQLGNAIEDSIKKSYTATTLETVQTTFVPPSFDSAKPLDRKLQPKERARPMDNLKIEDIWKSAQSRQYEAFVPGDVNRPLHPTAQTLLAELRNAATQFKGSLLSEWVDEQVVLEKHTFVGFASLNSLLVQYQTKLIAINSHVLIKCWLYQMAVGSYGHFDLYKINPGVDLGIIFGAEEAETLQAFEKNRKMLKKTFGIEVTDGRLETLPVLLTQFPPYSTGMVKLIKGISKIILESHTEEELARLILTELSDFYSGFIEHYYVSSSKDNRMDIISNIYRSYIWEDIRKQMYVTEEVVKEMRELVSVEKLYTIFERC